MKEGHIKSYFFYNPIKDDSFFLKKEVVHLKMILELECLMKLI